MEPRREQILTTALDLLAESGTKGLSHRGIDRRLGIPLGSTANYFSTRRALIDAVLDHVMDLELQAYNLVDPEWRVRDAQEAATYLTEFVRMASVGHLARRSVAVLSLTIAGEAQALRTYHDASVVGLGRMLAAIGMDEPEKRAVPMSDYLDGVILRIATGQRAFDEEQIRPALLRLLAP